MVSLVKKIDLLKHVLVPKHRILSEKEKLDVLARYNVALVQLPKILLKDAVIKQLDAKINDVIEIERMGPSGKYLYYRRVVE